MEEDNSAEESQSSLHSIDWLVIGAFLFLSSAIGVYYRFTGGRQKSRQEYFTADRSSGVTVLSMAIMVAFVSGVSILGLTGENYGYGIQYNIAYIGVALGSLITAYIYLPVYYELQIMSIFEYLEKRFGASTRFVASSVNFVLYCFITAIIIYAPSLTLEATTGINGIISIIAIGGICTFYSTIGGIKAIIATDFLQGILMFSSIIAALIIGFYDFNGDIWYILKIADEGGRLNLLKPDYDLTIRHTWPCLIIGGTFFFITQYAINQAQVQRMLTARTLVVAQKALFYNVLITLSLTTLLSTAGIIFYAFYAHCDPVLAGKIKSYDMILPYFAKDHLSRIPGLTGLFIAGVFSGSLSTVSAMLNSLSAVALSDYVTPICKWAGHEFSDRRAAFYGKLLALSIGILTLGLTFIASKISGLIQAVLTLNGVLNAPVLGLFTLGMMFESANETGVLIGSFVGLIVNILLISVNTLKTPVLPMSTSECPNSTVIILQPIISNVTQIKSHWITRLSHMWYLPAGFICTMIAGFIASIIINILSKKPRPLVDINLFTPFVAKRIRRQRAKTSQSSVFVLDTKK